jgi:hypothetical protein
MSKISNIFIIIILLIVSAHFTKNYWMPMVDLEEEAVITQEVVEQEETKQLSCIVITTPQADETISFPLIVKATIDYGCWIIFEAQAGTVWLFQNNQLVSSIGFLMVDGDYYDQANYPITAQAIIESSSVYTWAVELIISPENPCGDDIQCPPLPKPLRLPINIK